MEGFQELCHFQEAFQIILHQSCLCTLRAGPAATNAAYTHDDQNTQGRDSAETAAVYEACELSYDLDVTRLSRSKQKRTEHGDIRAHNTGTMSAWLDIKKFHAAASFQHSENDCQGSARTPRLLGPGPPNR